MSFSTRQNFVLILDKLLFYRRPRIITQVLKLHFWVLRVGNPWVIKHFWFFFRSIFSHSKAINFQIMTKCEAASKCCCHLVRKVFTIFTRSDCFQRMVLRKNRSLLFKSWHPCNVFWTKTKLALPILKITLKFNKSTVVLFHCKFVN